MANKPVMRAQSSKRRSAVRAFAELPETAVGEIIGDELHVSPRPAVRHAVATANLLTKLNGRFGGGGKRGGWHILVEPELHLGDDVLVPDLAGWRRERLPTLPDAAYFEVAPDWVCEVLSPQTARVDRMLKLPRYAAAGVTHAWLVDPALRAIEALGNERGRWVVLGSFVGDVTAKIPPFETFRLNLAALWAGFGEAP